MNLPARILVEDRSAPFGLGTTELGGLSVSISMAEDAGGLRLDWSVRNATRRTVHPRRVGVALPTSARRVMEHGWQSWSCVRTCEVGDVRPARRRAPAWRRAEYCLDPTAAGGRIAGDQFLVHDSGVAGFLTAERHFGTVVADPGGAMAAWLLLDGVELAPGASRVLEPLWLGAGDPGERYATYARRWGECSAARAATPAPLGWCSWYRFRAAVTPADVRRQIDAAAGAGLDFLQIDDGWQGAIGDWDSFSTAWRGGIAGVADDIRAAGLRAGIWTAPFLVAEHSTVASRHPDWLLTGRGGRPVRAMYHRGLWGGWALALDTTHPAVLDHLTETFAGLVGDGFDVHKVDFLYAGALAGHRHDRTATRAEALRRGLSAIRDAIGDGTFLIGCGSPLGPAAGLVDAMRVSPDAAPWWSRPAQVAGFDEAASSASNAMRTSTLRSPLHRRLWINDPDCLLLRHHEEERTAEQRAQVLEAVATAGCLVTLSDDLADYDARDWGTVAALRARSSRLDAPTTLVDPFAAEPAVVRAVTDRRRRAA